MRRPKIQNRIGRSIATLPVCALWAVSLWWLPQQAYSHDYMAALVLVALTAYLLTETSNTFQIIRTRSRMMPAVWLFTVTCMGFLHSYHPSLWAILCLSVSYHLLFRTYQQTDPVANVFHSFLFLSLGSMAWSPLILFAPFFLWYLIVFMRAFSLRAFCAALMGLVLPFWFWMPYLLWKEDVGPLRSWVCGLTDLHLATWHELTTPYANLLETTGLPVLAFLVFVMVVVWTSVYYLFNSYDDKIRTRMMLYIYVFQSALTILFALLTLSYRPAVPLLLLSGSPLVAHYFTLRDTWMALGVFLLFVAALLGLALLTLWPDFVINYVNPLFISE